MTCSSCTTTKSEADQRDCLSQENVILQAINIKDKSTIPEYLKYQDQGYMYLPYASFIPFLRVIDDCVKIIVNSFALKENGSEFKV